MKRAAILVSFVAAVLVAAPLASGHGGPQNHPNACKYYNGHRVLLSRCIRKCCHPHDRPQRIVRSCVRWFIKKNPIKRKRKR